MMSDSTAKNHSRSITDYDGTAPNDHPRCEECNANVSLYQCPGCLVRTCSLKCCQAHKKRSGCTGKRNRGSYLPLCRMNDKTVRSDYFFIEEVLESVPRARKISRLAEEISTETNNNNTELKHHPRSITSMNKRCRKLVTHAERRGISLKVMPNFMERHKNNTSWYCGPRDLITWKIEIIIIPSKKSFSFKLSEQEDSILECICDCMNGDLEVGDSHHLFIKRLPCSDKMAKYVKIHMNESLKKILEGLTIIEHPTIYCVPGKFLEDFPSGSENITEITTLQPRLNVQHDAIE